MTNENNTGLPLLDVKDLKTYFHTIDGTAKAVDGVSFSIRERQTLGLVGESGGGVGNRRQDLELRARPDAGACAPPTGTSALPRGPDCP